MPESKCNRGKLNPSSAETSISQDNYVNTMAADTLPPCVVGASATMILIKQDGRIFLLKKKMKQSSVKFVSK